MQAATVPPRVQGRHVPIHVRPANIRQVDRHHVHLLALVAIMRTLERLKHVRMHVLLANHLP